MRGTGSQSHILILGDIVLNLQISVHILQLLSFLLFEYGSLVSLANIGLVVSLRSHLVAPVLTIEGDWIVVTTAEENVT